MNDGANIPTVTNKTALAALYGVSVRVFNGWIDMDSELKKLFKPFQDDNKRTLPPYVTTKVLEVLGEP